MTTPPLERVLSRLENPKKQTSGDYMAVCPAHEDGTPSLSIAEGKEGNAVVHCHAGCAAEDVVSGLGLTMSDLFAEKRGNNGTTRSRIVKTYDYVDEAGELVLQTVRKEPKAFLQRRPDGRGGWIWNLKGVERVLYRLPEVLAAVDEGRTVWIVEGEKDADALAAVGEVATCNPQGALDWDKVPHTRKYLAGADVVVWVDDDAKGHDHGRQVVADLDGHVASWYVVRSPHAKDAADHLGQGRDLEDDLEVLAWSKGDRDWLDGEGVDDDGQEDDEPPPPALIFETVGAVAARVDAAPPPKFLARPVWVEDAYGVIGAEDKAGKSWAALDLAVSVASGGRWLDLYECEAPGPVCMFLGEGSDRKSTRRGRAVAEFHGVTWDELAIRVCHRAPNLTRGDHLEAIAYELANNPPRLVILDPLYLSLGTTKSGLLSEMGNVLGEIQHLAQASGAALVIVHHWNQTGSGTDRKRFTGAGAAEWGRVLASVAVTDKRTTDGHDSIVEQSWEFIGDEIPDTKVKVARRVWVDDVNDLQSPMHYAVVPPALGPHVAEEVFDKDSEMTEAILDALAGDVELSGTKLCQAVRDTGLKVRDRDVRRVAQTLSDGGPVRMRIGARNAQLFRLRGDTEVLP